ncbi:hypothetical protein [Leekyejoonella antrihumi]|uniref:Uncharacterized protein n=1 Tax=Leekyejoonella antrihumi TaxID=1660198 RepID=A0A563EB53_9MICO|nr:hypothetical protein [Leekyejoonella antrihumi]TWP39014.1 hypothetical protein FGL98_01075 [Leekyejoonella antrihumi]
MTQYLMIFSDRADAEEVAQELSEEEFTEVHVVREVLAGEDDSEDRDWAVHVVEDTIDDESGAVAKALRARFTDAAERRGGRLQDGPGAPA